MHLYNAWLPPAVAAETRREAESFAAVVRSVKETWRQDDPDSVFATLKWIAVIEVFVKAKSEVSPEDVGELLVFGLDLFHSSQNKLHVQVRWGNVLVKLLKKHGKKLELSIEWRPFYDCLTQTHFKRNIGPEGLRLRQRHFEMVTSLVIACRKFFPAGAAAEIWSEFKVLMENPWHNSAFEGSGFVQLFLPLNLENQNYYTSCWIKECLDLWETLPNCQFWDLQWTSILARCIKTCKAIDWEQFLPALFSRFLNMFEVPVSSGSGSHPFPLQVPRNMKFLFSSRSRGPAKAIGKSIVFLLRPGSSAQEHFERLANLLEQYYHPSNGGQWTYSLERFLRYLVIYFQKRLQLEQLNSGQSKSPEFCLGKLERALFVKVMLKLIDRGQYSKNESLAETVAGATSVLSYVEPSLVLPFVASRFQMALETHEQSEIISSTEKHSFLLLFCDICFMLQHELSELTATHQLKSAITSLAFTSRAFFLALCASQTDDEVCQYESLPDLIEVSLSNALLGMDANDPPKTMATMQLIGSIFSSITVTGNNDGHSFLQSINFSEWLDEFFCHLFSLLQHLEQSSVTNDVPLNSTSSRTFLVEESPYYFCMLQILLGKLPKTLSDQALMKISIFVNSNILPGATTEVGLLCCASVLANSEEAVVHLIKPILMTILSSFEGSSVTCFGGERDFNASLTGKAMLSPALETTLEYHLKVLAIAITYGGSVLLQLRDELKLAIGCAFQAPSWKVNGAGNHVLRSLLASLILYYPIDQFKSSSSKPAISLIEGWLCSKVSENEVHEKVVPLPWWHIPTHDELSFVTELLDIHFQSALDDLCNICHTKMPMEAGDEKEHLKVTLLRIYSSLQGIMSCLPDMHPSCKNREAKVVDFDSSVIAGAVGPSIGSAEMRERAAQQIHAACRYLLKERSEDSAVLILIIRIIDALGNFGSLEYEEWSSHTQAWKLESAAIIEPPCNFIIYSHARGKKRPRWALIDKAYMHNMWRSSQSSYHRFRTDGNISPSEYLLLLMEDLLDLSLHNYETIRSLAGRSLSKMLKRWPSLVSKCVLTLSAKLQDSKAPEHLVLGSCSVLSTQTVLRHLAVDAVSFSAFIIGLLTSSHHESWKAQKAIVELFVKYNIHFSGISRSFFNASDAESRELEIIKLISQISSLGFENTGLHWRYNLMANRVLLLLTLASRSDSHVFLKILGETAGHFLRNLKSQLPQSRILAISALNALLQGPPHKILSQEPLRTTGGVLTEILMEDGFFHDVLSNLSHVHIISDEMLMNRGSQGESSFQSLADKAITVFYFDFSASWPRTPNWISFYGGDSFYSNFARIFKRLIQECGMPALKALQHTLDEFSSAKERPKQCVAAEVMAGILHSDVNGLSEAWNEWLMDQLHKIMVAPSVETIPDWAACIRYAVTGKGRYGTRIPLLRQQILDFLKAPLPQTTTSVVLKRYAFLSVALAEIYPPRMPIGEFHFHCQLLEELLENMSHPSAQVREAIGVTLSVLCSNLRLNATLRDPSFNKVDYVGVLELPQKEAWVNVLTEGVSEFAVNNLSTNHLESIEISGEETFENASISKEAKADVRQMETVFHFLISSLKSGRSSYMLDIIVKLLYPVISLQETLNKDLSVLAKAAFELVKWMPLPQAFLESAVSVVLSSVINPNWRIRSASLSYLRIFLYRHIFTLSQAQKKEIWDHIEKLLVDNQVEVREQAAGVLAGLMKGGDEHLSKAFRERSYADATIILMKRKLRNSRSDQSIASTHGAVLALTASVLSVPYDMPSWLPHHLTLLAKFIGEPSPIKSTVAKAVAEFRRTHTDTWNIHKAAFSEEQLEVLADATTSSYFA